MPIRYKKCPVCGFDVELNGIGSKVAPVGTWILRKLLPFSIKSFDPAADQHDWRYAQYGYGKNKADSLFYHDMIEICEKKSFLTRWYFEHNAKVFYKYVEEYGHDAYHKAQTECLENQSCLCLDQFDCPVHPKPFPA